MKKGLAPPPAGFTLIELMVAVSILAVGLVGVLQSRLSILSALDSGVNQMRALGILEKKMNEIEEMAAEDDGITGQSGQEEIILGSRRATWVLETTPVDIPVPEAEEGETQKEPDVLLEVAMSLSWQEERKDKSISLVTFLPEKKEEIGE